MGAGLDWKPSPRDWVLESKHVGVLTEKARPEGWVFSQAQHPMIKTYYSMSLHGNTAIIVFKLLAIHT